CSPTSLQRRFFLPVAMDVNAVLARYGHYLIAGPPLGAAVLATVDRRPVGLLNLIVVGDRTVELSLLVADDWQRRGVATHLLDVELARARWAGWTVQALVQPDNGPVRSLLRGTRFGIWELVDRDPSAWDFALTLEQAPVLAVAG
ncbi:MAG: GNAT family N-acetyltransferase, partial [Pseudonocardia sp.]|nr:GNAT family N-acetyltransferase [Pseudonocardia sp.]